MPSEQVRFWLEALGSIAGVVALAAIALELIRARRADTRDFLFAASGKLGELLSERIFVNAMEFSNLENWLQLGRDDENVKNFTAVFNFWSLIAKTTKLNAINRNIIFGEYGLPFMVFYEKFSKLYHELAEHTGMNFFEELDWFANEFAARFPGKHELNKRHNEYVKEVKASK